MEGARILEVEFNFEGALVGLVIFGGGEVIGEGIFHLVILQIEGGGGVIEEAEWFIGFRLKGGGGAT